MTLGDSDVDNIQKMVVWGPKLDDVKPEGVGLQKRLLSN